MLKFLDIYVGQINWEINDKQQYNETIQQYYKMYFKWKNKYCRYIDINDGLSFHVRASL